MDEVRLGDRYVLRELLAEGGSASVYRADDTVLSVERAVKVLARVHHTDPGMRERFEREARMLARLRHPNVVSVHDMGESNGRFYIVMDLLPGGSLEGRLADGPLPLDIAVGFVRGILDALGAVHAEGIVHRDVKPANVLIDARGAACLTDFGIARLVEAAVYPTSTGSRLGTFAYMAPEQLDDPRSVDVRADVYAVGATLYTLVTGDPPFGLLDTERRAALLARVPVALRSVVARATQSRADARYAGVSEMAADLPTAVRVVARPPLAIGVGGVVLGLLLGVGAAELGGAAVHPADPVAIAAAAPVEPLAVATAVDVATAPTNAPAAVTPTTTVPSASASRPAARSAPSTPAVTPAATVVVPEAKGSLKVNAVPWSELSVDGRPVGRTPWQGELPPGPHTVRLGSSEGGAVVEESVTVASSEVSVFCWDHRQGAPCSR